MKAFLVSLALLSVLTLQAQQYQVNGDADSLSCNCYLLTPDQNGQSGSVWNTNEIDLNNSFDFTFDVFLGYNNNGADGIAFVLQPISTSIGSTGGGLGYQNINPSLAVEIDTYQNGSNNDPSYDHIGIQRNGDVNHGGTNNLAGPVGALTGNLNIEDGQEHLLRIVWDATNQTIDAYIDGDLKVTYTGDIINAIFSGDNTVFWGFTGSTGGARNEQRFCLSIIPDFNTGGSSFCAGTEVQITDQSYSGLGNISSWEWDFDNGQTSTQQNPVITYENPGNYNITQAITDQAGCSDTAVFSITVEARPTADLLADNVCQGEALQFTDQSTISAGTVDNWQWAFGDGNGSNTQNPSHTYDTSGTYTVSLVASTSQGCSDSITSSVEIYPLPTANAEYETDLLDVAFNNTSLGGVDYLWIFPDSSTSTLANPEYAFPDTGHYPVVLITTSANGCSDTTVLDVYLDEYVLVEVPNVFTPDGDGTNDTWRPTIVGADGIEGDIYNRWGIKMVSFSGGIAEWDGRTKGGSRAAAGTYFYHLKFSTIDGQSHNPTGTITLIR